MLRSEGALFFALTGRYKSMSYATAFPVFVERVERLAQKDVQEWVTDVIGSGATSSKDEGKGQTSSPAAKK